MRLIVDTNLFVSAAINKRGAPARLVERWLVSGEVDVWMSERLLIEVTRVMRRPPIVGLVLRNGIDPESFLLDIRTRVELVDAPANGRSFSRDPDDDAVIEAAIAAGADYIVSGDRDLLDLGEVEGIPVLTVAEFLERLGAAPDVP